MNSQVSPNSDELLRELEESIPQGQPMSTQPIEDEEDEGFAALDALLDESLGAVREKAQYEADLKMRKRGFHGMSKEEIDFCNSRMAVFEAARIWETQYAVSIWTLFQCQNCKRDRMVFSRLLEHQQSRHNAATRRWVTVNKTTFEATPVKELRPVPTCPRCSEWELDPRLMTDLKEIFE